GRAPTNLMRGVTIPTPCAPDPGGRCDGPGGQQRRRGDLVLWSAEGHRETSRHGGPFHQVAVPACDLGIVGEVHLMSLVAPDPAEYRKVGDRERTCHIGDLRETAVEDAVEP